MNKQEENKELCQRYLDNELSYETLINFKKQLLCDQELVDELFFQEEARLALSNYFYAQAKTEIKEIYDKVKTEYPLTLREKQKITLFSYWKRIAAGIIIFLVSVAGYLFYNYLHISNKKIVEENFTFFDATRGVTTSNPSKIAYQDLLQDYLNKINANHHYDDYFNAGKCYMALQMYNQAIVMFKQSIEGAMADNNPAYHNTSWYLALAYVGNNQVSAAIPVLEQLVKKHQLEVEKVNKAKKLLRHLKWKEVF